MKSLVLFLTTTIQTIGQYHVSQSRHSQLHPVLPVRDSRVSLFYRADLGGIINGHCELRGRLRTVGQSVVDQEVCDGQRALSEGEGERVGANGEGGHCQGRWLTGNSWRKRDQCSLT